MEKEKTPKELFEEKHPRIKNQKKQTEKNKNQENEKPIGIPYWGIMGSSGSGGPDRQF
jgi:hypothetical protein